MRRFLSHRVQGLMQSDIRRMSRECEKVGGINMAMGSCDLPTPPFVRDAAIAAIGAQKSSYTFPEGAAPLREALAVKLARDNGIQADPASEIVITVGSAGAFAATLEALLDPGDGVLILEPYYGYHLNVLLTVGLEPCYLTLDPPAFALREDALRRAVLPSTRAIVLCTPANPSGRMLSRAELEAVGRVAEERDLLVITDEIYEYIRFDGREHVSPASIDGLWRRTVSIMGFSKTFIITGWRLGYAVAPAALAQPITLINDLHYVCAPTPLQYAAVAGVQAPRSYFDALQGIYQDKRDRICDALSEAGLNPIVPEGAYYVLADIRELGFETSNDAAMELLRQSRVAAVPGTDFYRGREGQGVLRFCFAKDDAVLDEACRRIRQFRPAVATI
jgi:aminotransferase